MPTTSPAQQASTRPLRAAILRALTVPCLLMAAAPAAAQHELRRLTDADVQRVIPLMRAQVEEGRWMADKVRGYKQTVDQQEQFMKHVADGGINDPLAWLRERIPGGIPVPPGVTYHVGCSRAMSKQQYQPTAVFTFGVAATVQDRARREGRGDAAGAQAVQESGILELIRATQSALGGQAGFNRDSLNAAVAAASKDRSTPEQRQVQKFIDDTRAFYRARRFETRAALAPLHFESADGRMTGWLNPSIPTEKAAECGSMPDGPHIAVQYSPPEAPLGSDQSPLTTALARAGISQNEFQELYSAVLMASVDTADPNHATRKNNVEVYRRHAGTLDPLIAELKAMR